MKYSLKYPTVTFNILIDSNSYLNLKKYFHSQANSIDPEDDNIIFINEFDNEDFEMNPLFDPRDTPPIEIEKHFIEDFITNLVYRAEDLFKEGVMKELNNSETHGKSAILVLNNRFKDILAFYKEILIDANHLTSNIKTEIEESLNRLSQFVDEELSINVFKDFSENKIKLNLSIKEICWFMLYLDYKSILGKGHSRGRLIELIESHFKYYSASTKNFEEITTAKNTFSNILNSKNHNSKCKVLPKILVDFDNVFKKLLKS